MIKVGVIGVGSLGFHHARIFSSMEDVRLVGVCDVDVNRGKEVAKRFEVPFFSERLKLLEKCDAVSIVTPTTTHFEIAMESLSLNKHIFIEKPVTHSMETGEKLLNVAREKKVVIQVGHIERFNPSFISVKPFLKKARYVESKRLSLFTPRCLDVDVIFDLMIHDIDLILHIVKSDVTEIKSVGIPILSDKIDIANVRMEFENGVVANLSASRVSMKKVRDFRIFQENDYISLDLLNKKVKFFTLKNSPTKEIVSQNITVEDREPLLLELQTFRNAIQTGNNSGCTLHEGVKALYVATKILEGIKKV